MKQTVRAEARLLQGTSREFAQKVLLKLREENDRYPHADLDRSVFETAFGMDFFHLWLPESMGGLDGHIGNLCTILLNIAEVDASMAVAILTNAMSQEILLQAGEHQRIAEWYSRGASLGDALISFSAFANPMETPPAITALEPDGTVRLRGIAQGMALGNMAQRLIVPARIASDSEYSYFLVPSTHPTVRTGESLIHLGLHACPVVDIGFDGTPGILIGERGKAANYYGNMYGRLLPAGAAIATGIMRGSFNDALKYSRVRIQGGRKIGAWSEVQLLLADMALKVRNAELLIEHVSSGGGSHSRHDNLAASIPAFEHACEVTSDGVQILGGYGYMEDYSQEKRYRDAQQVQSLFGMSYLKKLHYVKTCCKLN
ncbi:MAG: acyl-CoA dehydrogenase family protein [Thermodesulfobacteriota bacterium]